MCFSACSHLSHVFVVAARPQGAPGPCSLGGARVPAGGVAARPPGTPHPLPPEQALCTSAAVHSNLFPKLKLASTGPTFSFKPCCLLAGCPSSTNTPLHDNRRGHFTVTNLAACKMVRFLFPQVDCDSLKLAGLLLPLPYGHGFAQEQIRFRAPLFQTACAPRQVLEVSTHGVPVSFHHNNCV